MSADRRRPSLWPRRPTRARCPCSAPMAVAFTATRALTACAPCVTRSICRGRTPESPPWLLSVRTAESAAVSCQCVEPGAFNSFFLHFYFLSVSLSFLLSSPRWQQWALGGGCSHPETGGHPQQRRGRLLCRGLRRPQVSAWPVLLSSFFPHFFNLFVGHGSAVEDNHSHLACWLQ